MPTIGVADILIRPSFKGLQQTVGRELDGVGESAGDSAGKGFGSKMTGAITGFMGGAMKAAGIAGGLSIGGAFGTALFKGFGRLQAIENAKAKLTGLGHSTEAVTGIMNDAMAAVKGTAFGLDEAASVAAGAVAAGIKPGKELEDTLRLTGDAATIAGVGLGEMGAIFNKVASSNKIQGDVIAQLNDAGIPIVQLLGKELGKSAEETLNLASQGKINFETFQKAMKAGLGGAALESGKTLEGAFKNTMAAVGRIGANLLSGVYPKIQQFFAGAIDWLKPLEEGAKVAGVEVGKVIDKALSGAKGLYDLIVKGDYTGKLQEAFGWAEDSPFVDFLFRVRDALLEVMGGIKTFAWGLKSSRDDMDNFGGAIHPLMQAGFDLKEAFKKASEVVKKAFEDIVSYIQTDLIPAFESMGKWVKDNKDWLESLAVGVGAAVAAFKIYTTTLAIHAAVTGGMAAAQTAMAWTAIAASIAMYNLNAAMKANMIGIIVFAIIGLVSGLIWFFTQTELGKDIVKNVWAFIQAVIGGVVDWFTNTALPAIQGFIGGIGDVLTWLYENIVKPVFEGIVGAVTGAGDFFGWLYESVIKPVFNGIAAAITWVYESIIKPVFDGISAAVTAVGDVFNWLWTNILKPVFDSAAVIIGGFYLFFRGIFQLVASVVTYVLIPLFMIFWSRMVEAFAGIGATISQWWDAAVAVFNTVVSFISSILTPIFDWFAATAKLVFESISLAVSVWWANVQANFNMAITFVRDVLGAVFTWLYASIIKPVFDMIGAVIGFVWAAVIKPILDAWVSVFQGVGQVFQWVYSSIIKPAFEGVGNAIKWVWDNIIKPVFDTLSNFITKTIPDAFESGVGFIKTAWDKLIEIAKMPVRFVIDTVINDGLIGAFNTVAGILPGIDKLPRVALPAGFMNGGYTGDGGKDEPKGVVHGGEFVLTKEQTRKAGVRNLYDLARSLDGYAKGGFVNPLKQLVETQGYNRVHKGVDFAAGVGTPVFAVENGRVSWSGPGVRAPGVWGGNEIHVDGGSGIQSWFAHLSSMAVKVGDMVRAGQQIATSGNTGISSGPHLHFGTFAGGWPNDINPYGVLSGAGNPSGGGFNPLAGIIDGLLAKFREAFPAAGMIADLAIGVGKKLFGGVTDLITGNHGSVAGDPALYDLGGILPPGISQVVNRTGKPEAILNPQQWADISRLATQDGGGFNAEALDRLTAAVRSARPITVQQMSSTQAQANALARALEGV